MLLKPETQWRSQILLRQKEDYVRSLMNKLRSFSKPILVMR
jgi:hypothetical protein